MPVWLIPMIYTALSVAAGLTLPRLENAYLAGYLHGMSASSALVYFSTIGTGMMALTGIVFAIAFVVVQFGALAYSPRLVVMFAGNPRTYHALGIFFATFSYSLAAIAWTDRSGSGTVPFFSTLLVGVLLIASMLTFVLMIRSLNELQIHNVLYAIGARGRAAIRPMFPDGPSLSYLRPERIELGPVTQRLFYAGEPRVVEKFEIQRLVRLAEKAQGVIAMSCAVGDTLVEGSQVLQVHAGRCRLPDKVLLRAIRLASSRTFEQDPKYPLRLLVDIAIRALSPAVNDPTTAVQAIDQIEDLLRRLGARELDAGYASDADGVLRLTVPVPTWEDYLALSFDEIRLYGGDSLQVMRRLRAALVALSESVIEDRRQAVRRCLDHLNASIGRSAFDDDDRANALAEDRQGLGLSGRRADGNAGAEAQSAVNG